MKIPFGLCRLWWLGDLQRTRSARPYGASASRVANERAMGLRFYHVANKLHKWVGYSVGARIVSVHRPNHGVNKLANGLRIRPNKQIAQMVGHSHVGARIARPPSSNKPQCKR